MTEGVKRKAKRRSTPSVREIRAGIHAYFMDGLSDAHRKSIERGERLLAERTQRDNLRGQGQ